MPRRRRRRWGGGDWPVSLSASERQLRATQRRRQLSGEPGRRLSPVVIDGRHIATTFWGQAWCDNLERYSDFANRLPRGRSYVRSGAVLDLQIRPGTIAALVSGTDLYRVAIDVVRVPDAQWDAICRDVSGAIESVVELLQGRLSKSVMARLCERGAGLFPTPQEIRFTCSCPDAAAMCKHIAAVLYGIGARLDAEPALLFTLRQVEERDLITRAEGATALVKRRGAAGSRRLLDESVLGEVFGLDIAPKKPTRRTRRPRDPL